jgi:hypothetical protein
MNSQNDRFSNQGGDGAVSAPKVLEYMCAGKQCYRYWSYGLETSNVM